MWRVPSTGEYFLSRYEDVIYVLRHPELFPHTSTSSEFRLLQTDAANRYYEEHGWRRKQTLGIDPPVHREYRVLVDPWFNGAGAERARPVIERLADVADGRVDRRRRGRDRPPVRHAAAGDGHHDGARVPARRHRAAEAVVGGVGDAVLPRSQRRSRRCTSPSRASSSSATSGRTSRRSGGTPSDDVLSHLAHARFQDAEHGERPLTDAEIINLIDHLFIGGNETTTFAITSGLWLLTSHPEVERRLRERAGADPDVRRRGAAPGVADAGPVAGRGPRRRDRRRADPQGRDGPHPLRRRQPRLRRCSPSRTTLDLEPAQRRPAPGLRRRRAPLPRRGPLEARAAHRRRALPAAHEQPPLHARDATTSPTCEGSGCGR